MENENYYQANLETGKLNIHTSKAFYDKLSVEQQRTFTHYCLWSRKQECWISKAKSANAGYLKTRLNELGFSEKGPVGERLSFQEQVEREQHRAERRADRSEYKAEKTSEESNRLYEKAKDMASIIPFGQPILVGHHSEQRDRNYRSKIQNTYGKAFELQDKVEYYKDKAEAARYTADGLKYQNPNYLQNKIKECDRNLRLLDRRLKGKLYERSPEREITQEARDHYNRRIAEEQDKLQFFEAKMKEVNPAWERKEKKHEKSQGKKI